MNTFRKALQSEQFAITAELYPSGLEPTQKAFEQACTLSSAVNGIVLGDAPDVSATALATLLAGKGIDPVVRLNCRDRNRIALQSDLLGLRAIGVSSLLLNRDVESNTHGQIPAKAVFDLNGRELTAMAHSINEEEWSDGHHELLIGTSASVVEPTLEWTGEHLVTRAGAGARYLQTRLCFDVDLLRRYMHRLVEMKLTWSYSVIATLAPLPSVKAASLLLENRRGTIIPKTIIRRLEAATNSAEEGIEICAEQMREVAEIPGISGINLLALNGPQAVSEAIGASGLRPD